MFAGRQAELAKLEHHWDRETFQMAVIYGRRRVGKTRLITEFTQDKPTLFFTALEQADSDNLKDFSARLTEFFALPAGTSFESWRAAFDYLADRATQERFVVVLDEFPYAAARNESLPSLLQILIDHKLSSTGVFLILCGSNQGFMESEVLGRKSPLYGRRTVQMKLTPLGFREAALMTPWAPPHEAFAYYALLGGTPYYLAQADPDSTFAENLENLYFDSTGFLYGEPQFLLRQELAEPSTYNTILRAIASGANRPKEISDVTGISATSLPPYLATLINLGIVERAVPFGENPERSRKGIYRILDAAFDFWFRFVFPNIGAIESGLGAPLVARLDEGALAPYFGYRFERLCAEWIVGEALADTLPISITAVGSWWGSDPRVRERVDVDLVAADVTAKAAIFGECKYRNTFDETQAFETLASRAQLLPYEPATFVLFSKNPLSEATQTKVASDPLLRSVTLEQMYANPQAGAL